MFKIEQLESRSNYGIFIILGIVIFAPTLAIAWAIWYKYYRGR